MRFEKINKKVLMALSEIILMLTSIIAFSFIIGGMTAFATPIVSAEDTTEKTIETMFPKKCCMEDKDGGICQNMNPNDASLCKTDLLYTSCENIDTCGKGCCYNPLEGDCSLNAPREKCEENGGTWNNDPTCNIAQCQLACCVIGDQASIKTIRGCSVLSEKFGLKPNFAPFDSDGSCNSKTRTSVKGACLIPAKDYSGLNDCSMTTKEMCKTGEFREGYLCTAEELKTTCKPKKATTCVEGKDQIFYLDSCGNAANVYDAKKYDDKTYWAKIIAPDDKATCTDANANCGNCDYRTGSICRDYRAGKDTKATIGNNVCRDLNCLNGRKNGESWCIEDYTNRGSANTAPIGSRSFIGKCVNGEITIGQCADFNQEVCVSEKNDGLSEAVCMTNEWRSCISANEKDSYNAVERECKKYDQCVMFLDIKVYGKYGELAGFKKIANELQGAAGDVGKGANKVVPYCIPRYTPGMVFWNTENPTGSKYGTVSVSESGEVISEKKVSPGNQYGGSYEETKSICALASFTCATKYERWVTMWEKGTWLLKDNPECMKEEDPVKAQLFTEALNERCRALGPCGVYVNIAGELGNNGHGDKFKRTDIGADGDKSSKYDISRKLSSGYLNAIKTRAKFVKPGSMAELTGAVISYITGQPTAVEDTGDIVIEEAVSEIKTGQAEKSAEAQTYLAAGGAVGALALGLAPTATIAAGSTIAGSATLYAGSIAVVSEAGVTTVLTATAAAPITITEIGGTQFVAQGVIEEGIAQGGKSAIMAAEGGVKAGADVALTPAAASGSMGFLASLGWALAAAAAAYMIGGLLGKWFGMGTAQSQTLAVSLASGAGVGTFTALYFESIGAWGGTGIGLAVMLIVSFLVEGTETKYYITEYSCEPWEPPKTGKCDLCNKDIRTCSEYRCRSLGQNCHYFIENGEPGYCGTMGGIWSAKITPWQNVLSSGNKYVDATGSGFKIQGNDGEKVEAWKSIQFGIQTDKPATCKLDNVHTSSYDEMKYEMEVDIPANSPEEAQNKNQGYYHKIVLSPSVMKNSSSSSTPPLASGEENNYYIRCQNFAGQVNEAEFAVRVIVSEGPDLTPPIIKGFSLKDNAYLAVGTNSTRLALYVDEPSDCKFSQKVNNRYIDMTENMTCVKDSDAGVRGLWPCYAQLKGLEIGENKFYFKCRDQPKLAERLSSNRNTNENANEYTLNVCKDGLAITRLTPRDTIISGKNYASVEINAETMGCIDGGISTCSYQFEGSSNSYIPFLETNSKKHKQIFTDMPAGNNTLLIKCIDEAGNSANDSLNVFVYLDDIPPTITRTYLLNQKIYLETDENSVCKYNLNDSVGCLFDFEDINSSSFGIMSGTEKQHSIPWAEGFNPNYYIKCSDVFNNTNTDCAFVMKTY